MFRTEMLKKKKHTFIDVIIKLMMRSTLLDFKVCLQKKVPFAKRDANMAKFR